MDRTSTDAAGLEIHRADVSEIFTTREDGGWHVERAAKVVAKDKTPTGSRLVLKLNARKQVEHSRTEVIENDAIVSVTEQTTQFDTTGVLPLMDVKTFNGKVVARRVRTYH